MVCWHQNRYSLLIQHSILLCGCLVIDAAGFNWHQIKQVKFVKSVFDFHLNSLALVPIAFGTNVLYNETSQHFSQVMICTTQYSMSSAFTNTFDSTCFGSVEIQKHQKVNDENRTNIKTNFRGFFLCLNAGEGGGHRVTTGHVLVVLSFWCRKSNMLDIEHAANCRQIVHLIAYMHYALPLHCALCALCIVCHMSIVHRAAALVLNR